jgi:hypothetical protein
VWGSFEKELDLNNYTNSNYSVSIRNSLLRTEDYASIAAIAGGPGANLVNVTDPLFVRTSLTSTRPDYRLQDASPATTPRRPAADTVPPRDLLNLPRNLSTPSLGAYEHK